MAAFLVDENISPETAEFLERLGHSCHSILRDGPRGLSDRQIAKFAQERGLVIITHDMDFGQIYYFAERGGIGVIVLRLKAQTIESVNEVLARFLAAEVVKAEMLAKSLVIVTERSFRIYQGTRGGF